MRPAPTFVLLHGFTGAPASWDAVVARLPAEARVLRPALTGHAGPGETERPSRFLDEVARLREGLTREDVRGAHLVGYSLGGRVGYHLLAAAPERFARATLIGAHPGLADPEARAARRRADARWIARLEDDGLDAFVDAWAALPLWASQRALAPEVRAAQDRIRRGHDPRGLAHALRVLGLAEMPPVDPARLACPVHLVVGAADDKHRALSRALAARLPAGRFTAVAGAGHNVPLERPDRLAALLLEEATP
jgi:2-succinyl-6-hydroxy-2,4-cyclohexadiene-1-carboxylate synthase